MAFWTRFRRSHDVEEAATKALAPGQTPERAGFVHGIPRGGLTEWNAGIGEATQTDRRSQLQQLYESYLACPWAWASVNAIARTITAGGLVMDWDSDTGEGNQEIPEKPAGVLAVERLIKYTNDRQNIRQLMRNVVVDLLVFGDAYLEVVWWGNTPVALYNLDNPTTTPIADEHGKVTSYVQLTEYGQRVELEPRDVIHISLDAPRSGVFGVAPTQAALLPITAWLFAAATLKEMFRKGLPPTVHADFPAGVSTGDQNRWVDQVMARNIGPRNIGRPWVTKGGGKLTELQAGKVRDALDALNQKRDEVISTYGVPPAKVGIIEAGNLGGGTGGEQDQTYRVDVCQPIAELVLEAFNFAVVQNGFGVTGWQAKFREVDYRASKLVSDIQDQRIRNGSTTINAVRAENGEAPVDGGDDPVIIDRQNLVLVRDLAAMSKATVAGQVAKGIVPAAPAGLPAGPDGQPGAQQDDAQPGQDSGQDQPAESVPVAALARYRRRLSEALTSMDLAEASSGSIAKRIYDMLAPVFPAPSIAWITDEATSWSGPKMVPVDQIDIHDSRQWDAERPQDAARIEKARRRLRKKLMAGKNPKPIILIRWPGAKHWVISDGHHRFVAAQREGHESIWAYTGKVPQEKGHWLSMATHEDRSGKNGKKAA